MEYFWYTKFTIPDGHGFALFGPQHLAWLAAAAAVCLVVTTLRKRWYGGYMADLETLMDCVCEEEAA